MADVNYSGQQAKNIYDSIVSNAEKAEKAYKKAVEDWTSVQESLKVTGLTAKIDEVADLHADEISKIVSSLANMETSVANVDSSWQGVVAEMNQAIETYKGNVGE